MTGIREHAGSEFLADFDTLSQFGRTAGGGVERQAGSEADAEQRSWFADWLRAHDFDVVADGIGNQFGLWEHTPGAAWILVGSHLDSQPLAGRFDGAYGVLAAAHAGVRVRKRFLEAMTLPPLNLAVTNWFNEEGSRFKPSMMGSGVFTRKLSLPHALSTADHSGTTVGEVLDAMGQRGEHSFAQVAGYAEIHIEQGRVLEQEQTTIGVVDATWAAHKLDIVVRGEQSHTGSTVMAERRDAVLGAAMLVVAVRDLSDKYSWAPLHTSVSEMHVLPNSPVVVAREVRMHVDLRSSDPDAVAAALAELDLAIASAEERARVTVERQGTHEWSVREYPATGVALAEDSADALGLSHRRIMTIAGHDSTNMNELYPTVMLFVPSVDGVSHNEGEYTRPEDACAGVDVLTEVVHRMVSGELARPVRD